MLDRLRSGEARSVTFVAPTMTGWLLPLYELALMTARELARPTRRSPSCASSPRRIGLWRCSAASSARASAGLLAAAGIEFVHASFTKVAGGGLTYAAHRPADPTTSSRCRFCKARTWPVFRPRPLTGSSRRRVRAGEGLADVYAAGDAVDFPVKQGGLAAQQADAVAEHVAASYGAGVEPSPFRPVLRGMLFTGDEPLYMRSGVPAADPDVPGAWYPLWWPPTKVAGRYLAPYLFGGATRRVRRAARSGSPTSTSRWRRSRCRAERHARTST